VLVICGEAANKAKEWLADSGARSMVSYLLPLLFMGTMLTGCATHNMRGAEAVNFHGGGDNISRSALKPLEVAADMPPERSLRMPSRAEAEVIPPQPYGWLYRGDQVAYERAKVNLDKTIKEGEEAFKAGTKSRGDVNREQREARKAFAASAEEITPELWLMKTNTVPPELMSWQNPIQPDAVSLERGARLFKTNCQACHGEKGLGDGPVGEPMGVKPAKIGDPSYQARPDGYLFHFIMTGKNQMPTFGYRLNAREICDIINHLRHLQGKF
jgi:mono/diheme cytochrome c family protein